MRPSPFPFGMPVSGLATRSRFSRRRGMGDDTSDVPDDFTDDGGGSSDDDLGDILGDGSGDDDSILGGTGTDTSSLVDGVDLSSLQDFAGSASNSTGSGTSTLGSITSFLQSNGLNLGQIANVISTALQQPNNTAAQQAYLQQELAFAQAQSLTSAKTSTSSLVIIGAVILGVYFLTKK